MTKIKLLVLLLILSLIGAVPALADSVTFDLVNASLNGTPGSTLTWQYDVTNHSGGSILGLSVNSDLWQNGTPDASVFDGFGAGIADGSSMIGSLFSFTADPSVLYSFNSGSFDLQVLLADGSVIDLFQNYSATIAPAVSVPEPSAASLLLLTLLGLSLPLLWRWRQLKTLS